MDTEDCNPLHPHILTDRPEEKRLFWPIWTNSSSGKLLSRKIMCKIMTLLLLLLFLREVPPNIISTDQTVQETKRLLFKLHFIYSSSH